MCCVKQCCEHGVNRGDIISIEGFLSDYLVVEASYNPGTRQSEYLLADLNGGGRFANIESLDKLRERLKKYNWKFKN